MLYHPIHVILDKLLGSSYTVVEVVALFGFAFLIIALLFGGKKRK